TVVSARPVAWARTVNLPGGTSWKKYSPWPFVAVCRSKSRSTLRRVTVVFGMTANWESNTRPTTVPVNGWARVSEEGRLIQTSNPNQWARWQRKLMTDLYQQIVAA